MYPLHVAQPAQDIWNVVSRLSSVRPFRCVATCSRPSPVSFDNLTLSTSGQRNSDATHATLDCGTLATISHKGSS